MEVSQLGPLVRAQRKACGLSQKDVARLAGLSRATINYLENDPDVDIGVVKLHAVLKILGLAVAVTPRQPSEDVELVDTALARLGTGSKANAISRDALVEAVVTGRPPLERRGALGRVLAEAPAAVLVAAVRLAVGTGDVSAKEAWRHLHGLAAALEVTGAAWAKS